MNEKTKCCLLNTKTSSLPHSHESNSLTQKPLHSGPLPSHKMCPLQGQRSCLQGYRRRQGTGQLPAQKRGPLPSLGMGGPLQGQRRCCLQGYRKSPLPGLILLHRERSSIRTQKRSSRDLTLTGTRERPCTSTWDWSSSARTGDVLYWDKRGQESCPL